MRAERPHFDVSLGDWLLDAQQPWKKSTWAAFAREAKPVRDTEFSCLFRGIVGRTKLALGCECFSRLQALQGPVSRGTCQERGSNGYNPKVATELGAVVCAAPNGTGPGTSGVLSREASSVQLDLGSRREPPRCSRDTAED
jgi:hypothetical protein